MRHAPLPFALRALVALCLLVASAPPARAQLSAPAAAPIIGARLPALSPDGKQLAFVYRGDIWTAPATGGRAAPLTSHVEQDSFPLFSPDGKWIAFSSRRTGSWDIFVIPAEGGAAQQLTWHANAETPYGWSPDGKYLLFSGKRDSVNYGVFALDVKTLATEKLFEDFATLNYPSYSPDGKDIVYGRYGFPSSRPRYVGSAAAQIWLFNTADKSRKAITTDDRQHLWTKFLPGDQGLLTVTFSEPTPSVSKLGERIPKITDNPARTPNLWVFQRDGKSKQLTRFTGGSVRAPSVATTSGDLAFEYGADLWLLKNGATDATKISLLVATDEKQNSRRREKLTTGVTEAELSNDGKRLAFGLRGDIWVVPVEKSKGVAGRGQDIARRLTDWAGDDSDFCWSPDDKKLFFTSDREFNTRIYDLEVETLKVKPLWKSTDNVTHLRLSPDGKQLGFWLAGPEGGLYSLTLSRSVVTTTTNLVTNTVTNGVANATTTNAVTNAVTNTVTKSVITNIVTTTVTHAITNGEPKRIARVPGTHQRGSGGSDYSWSPDLQWIAYARKSESHSFNLWIVPAKGGEAINVTRLNAHHSQPTWSPDGKYLFFQSNRDGDGLYVLPLTRETSRTSDIDLKFEKPKDPVKVEIDFTDISRRIRKVGSQSPTADLTVTIDGLILFLSEGDVWSVTYDGKETKRLTTGGGKAGLRTLADARKGCFIQNGELFTMKPDDKMSPTKVSFTADWERDVRAERLAAFTQFWREYHRNFYDPNFHGRDWEKIRKQYEPLLSAVDTNEEFANVLNQMVGELEASHSEVTPATSTVPEIITPHLGFTFDYSHKGPGIKVATVPAGTPGSYEKTQIKPGEFILAINGTDVTLNEKLYQLINDRQDREFDFLINDQPKKDGARKLRYKPLAATEWDELNYRNRVERSRKYVENNGCACLGYLHIPAMSAKDQLQFEREAYEYMAGKAAMIIDVRFNRGGNISDTLINMLERRQHGYTHGRDDVPEPSPSRAWDKPVIVLMNEHSYSNGEMFPYAMRQRGLAKLVGLPTPGYVIWTSTLRLGDGTGARMPQAGVYRLDGTNQENIGERPDYLVPLTPADWLANRDPQLDKAIELLTAATAVPAPAKTGAPPGQSSRQ